MSETRAAWHDAHRICHDAVAPLASAWVPLDAAMGRILTADVVARCDVPHYASSAMDGWAVAGDPPWRVVDSPTVSAGQAVPIVTGGQVPPGTFSIVRNEHVSLTHRRMLTLGPAAGPLRGNDNIRAVGEEARRSEVVLRSGTMLNPAQIALAAVCGHDLLPVRAIPRVRLVLTGDEVVAAGIPRPGRVRDALGPQLPAVVGMLGGTVTHHRLIGDNLRAMVDALAGADADLVITTGGTSGSRTDHLRPALDALGATLLVDGVAMRPGGPSLLARLPDNRFLVGLPGNPLAAMVGMLSLVRPLLAGLRGLGEPRLGTVVAGEDLAGARGLNRLIPYRLTAGRAFPTGWRGSAMLRGLAEADGLLICPAGGVRPGDEVETLPLPW